MPIHDSHNDSTMHTDTRHRDPSQFRWCTVCYHVLLIQYTCTINQQPARSHKSSMSRHLHLTVFQLLVRCVHPRSSDILRTWSTIARSVIVWVHLQIVSLRVSYSLQVHRWWAYWQAQRTSVSKDESTESMISKRVQRSTQWLAHGSPSGSIGLP